MNYTAHYDTIVQLLREGRTDAYIARMLGGEKIKFRSWRREHAVPSGKRTRLSLRGLAPNVADPEAAFAEAMRGRLFSIRITRDGGRCRLPSRPEPAALRSSMDW